MTMDDAALRGWRAKLLEMRAELDAQEDAARGSRDTVTLDQQSVGRLSRMDAMQQQAMARATHARRQQAESRIRAALARLDEGEYGYCTECGEEIAPKRLEFDPAIPTCVNCAAG